MIYIVNKQFLLNSPYKGDTMAATRKDDVKKIILDTATNLLEKKSFNELSLREISETSGISKGTLYYYYKNKDDIIFDINEMYLDKLWSDMIMWVDDKNKDTSLPRLCKYVLLRGVDTSNMRLHLILDCSFQNENLRKRLIERYNEFQTLIEKKLSERIGDDAKIISWLLLLLIDGVNIQQYIGNDNLKMNEFISVFEEFVRKEIK